MNQRIFIDLKTMGFYDFSFKLSPSNGHYECVFNVLITININNNRITYVIWNFYRRKSDYVHINDKRKIKTKKEIMEPSSGSNVESKIEKW